MLTNHLRIALRSIQKHRGYSAINLVGLAVGLASSIIIMLFVRDELSYDRFHADADRIYRVVADEITPGGDVSPRIGTPGALKDAMLRELPEIEQVTRVIRNSWGKTLLRNEDDDPYYGDNLLYVGDSFFEVFSFHFVEGDRRTAFDDPSSVVLTKTLGLSNDRLLQAQLLDRSLVEYHGLTRLSIRREIGREISTGFQLRPQYVEVVVVDVHSDHIDFLL